MSGRRTPTVDLDTVVRHSGPLHKVGRHKRRYVVMRVNGWGINPGSDVRSTSPKIGQTWVVLDSANCYVEVMAFVNHGRRDASAKARRLADQLNREDS